MSDKAKGVLLVSKGSALADAIRDRLVGEGYSVATAGLPLELGSGKDAGRTEGYPGLLVFVADDGGEEGILDTSLDEWRDSMDAGVDSAIAAAQLVWRGIPKRDNGDFDPDGRERRIVFVVPDASAYDRTTDVGASATAWGIRGLARHLALNLAPANVLVNTVACASDDDDGRSQAADAVALLLGPDASNVTGSTIVAGDGVVAF